MMEDSQTYNKLHQILHWIGLDPELPHPQSQPPMPTAGAGLFTREGRVHRQHALLHVTFKLVLVQILLRTMFNQCVIPFCCKTGWLWINFWSPAIQRFNFLAGLGNPQPKSKWVFICLHWGISDKLIETSMTLNSTKDHSLFVEGSQTIHSNLRMDNECKRPWPMPPSCCVVACTEEEMAGAHLFSFSVLANSLLRWIRHLKLAHVVVFGGSTIIHFMEPLKFKLT